MAAEQAWFTAGTIAFMGAGGGHALAALLDTVRPTFFGPVDESVRSAMEGTTFRFRRMWPGANDVTPSMWRLWLGFNISHGLGAFLFGLLCLLIASHDFALVESIGAIRPLTIAVSAAYFVVSLRFWFYVPAIITGGATICFTVAAVL
ncbi:MAG TPA: hypothetical protein VFY45_27355 [Baekduia sp.]|nr:hypothetical protein [Baekduia sp.]